MEKITREQCEAKIYKKLKDIEKIYQKYNPGGNYLNLLIGKKGNITFSNAYLDEDKEKPISNFNGKSFGI